MGHDKREEVKMQKNDEKDFVKESKIEKTE